ISHFRRRGDPYPPAKTYIHHELQNRVAERRGVLGPTKDARASVLQYLRWAAYRSGNDGKSVEHAFEDHHTKGLIPTWHSQHVGCQIPLDELCRREPTREMYSVPVSFKSSGQPPVFHVGATATAVAACEDETRRRCLVQHAG